ncbi:unnamed protein product [Mytilus edulis]|uniref:Uncharacterized protein n=1 Tax=Mytilus edulis TaxID=6550 RepID=A0A8S3VE57_MYTED|nr:unnamed protein product [Mytilus edulis]
MTAQQVILQTTDKECMTVFFRTGERGEGQPAVLLKPDKGKAVRFDNGAQFERSLEDTFILADGFKSRIVIVVNGRFPGPTITARRPRVSYFTGPKLYIQIQCKAVWNQFLSCSYRGPENNGIIWSTDYTSNSGPTSIVAEGDKVFVAIIQDWNHDDDEDALYQKMLWGVYDSSGNLVHDETVDPSGARYSRFKCHSGLINGRGRFYRSSTEHNEVPLTRFEVEQNEDYRFRVISAATLYPFRVFVEGHRPIYVEASDGFEIDKKEVESFIIHPGERIDFLLNADEPPGSYLLVAETLEVYSENEYHAAEAIIHYKNADINLNPPKTVRHTCDSSGTTCRVFNCPFTQFSSTQKIKCVTFNDVISMDPNSNTDEVKSDDVVEMFFNFAFPGENGYTPGSVNGHQFLPPTVAAYAQPDLVDYNCNACNASTICECTYAVTIDNDNKDRVYQFVITNIGGGAGWSHPVHLHGHSFYVMKMVFATYDRDGKLMPNGTQDNIDILCPDSKNFCSDAKWRNESWANGRHPDLNWSNPPQKDTIIIPTGGYVIIRFKADNPGVWFFHCHIDLHNTNGMGMIINESPKSQQSVPDKFPKCGSFLNDDLREWSTTDRALAKHASLNPECEFLSSIGHFNSLQTCTNGTKNVKQEDAGDNVTDSPCFSKDLKVLNKVPFSHTSNNSSLQPPKGIYNPKHAAYDDKLSRMATFEGVWRSDIEQTAELLADSGFFYEGEEDTVRCHYCDGGLRNWEPGDVPWEEHARWFPFCKFVIKMKGREFIDEIKAKYETAVHTETQEPNTETSIRNGAIVKSILDMGFQMKDIRYAANEYTKHEGNIHYNTEDLLRILIERHETEKLKLQFEGDPEKVREVNKELKKKMMCIRCEKTTKSILFVECGHRVTCETCANDVCYAKKYVEPGGIELFDLGCGAQSLCSTSDPFGKRDIVETDIEDDKGTSTICLACCNTTDLCNINGLCGAPPFIALPGTSLCYDCEVSRQPDDCTKITLCNTRQSCHLESTRNLIGDIRWRHGCVDKKQCQTSNSSQCSYCCNTDLCNTNTTFTQSPTSDNLFAVSKPHISGLDVQPRYIRYGSTVTIKCIVSGNPTPSVSFLVQADAKEQVEKAMKLNADFKEKFNLESPITAMWEFIKTSLLTILEQTVPSKMSSSRFNQPWINQKIKKLTRQKKRSFEKARKTKRKSDLDRYHRLKAATQKECRKAYRDYINDIINPELSANPKRFWGFIKSKKCESETLHLPSTMLYMLVSRDVTGNPTPSINFVVQGKSLASNVHVAGNTATISNYLPRNDDVYRCQATNCLDNSFYQFQLQAHL